MCRHDPRIDAYIAHAATFAQPLLRAIRQRVHQGCGEATEAIKWGMPAFLYRGKLLCTMAAFKQHAALGLWQRDNVGGTARSDDGMGQYGRLTGLQDLPDEAEFTRQLAQGMQRIDAGTAVRKSTPRPALAMPADFAAALRAAPAAQATFDGFAPGYRRDYLEWILEAKRDATRQQRIAQAVQWLGEGKRRHWKHETR
ncbi:YdeI/OmpD-associated family protein [Stenotrophomonas sp. YIM B06876]|uniref:YdeI/OmpD-associated family protein n=1 Tax=Stenotrophomonas sp. YIM B06876 TaxID=3060211 RepID=UPI00273A39BB|nr:YdeI/OmpD-associated family protein [Stenotrophomonas sp. YIM B06876]